MSIFSLYFNVIMSIYLPLMSNPYLGPRLVMTYLNHICQTIVLYICC